MVRPDFFLLWKQKALFHDKDATEECDAISRSFIGYRFYAVPYASLSDAA